MINIFLFLAVMFAITFIIGGLIERVRVPWIFGALILGSILAIKNPFLDITSSSQFGILADLGLFFLLFVIGFEIDLKKLLKESKFIFKATLFIIFFEAIFGSLIVHYVFGYDWAISIVVAMAFATVGEAILIPILDEFKIINTRLGRAIIGIGTFDDGIEILALILAIMIIGSQTQTHMNLFLIIGTLGLLFVLPFTFKFFSKQGTKFKFFDIDIIFFFMTLILFLFIGIGSYAEAASLGALLAGISLKAFLPKQKDKTIEKIVKAICYGFFAPIFFLSVGLDLDIHYLVSYPLLVLLVVGVSKGAKLLSSYLVGRKILGTKKSILMGIGLSVRFSMSIVIIKLLFDSGVVSSDLYSVIIASSIIFKFLVPFLFSYLLVKWGIIKRANYLKRT